MKNYQQQLIQQQQRANQQWWFMQQQQRANQGQNPHMASWDAVGAVVFVIFMLLSGVGILSAISQSQQSELDFQEQQQEQCKTWPDPATRPPWCN